MGMSKLISLVIGPAGWLFFGVSLFAGFGGPNHKKLLPIVVLVAAYRHDLSVKLARAFQDRDSSEWIDALGEIPSDAALRKNRLDYIEQVARRGASEWPDEKRWNMLSSLAGLLKGNRGDAGALGSWLASELAANNRGAREMAEVLLKWISAIAPERLELLLEALLDANPMLVRLVYAYAPEGGDVHYRAVFTIAQDLQGSLSGFEGTLQ